MRLQTLKEAKYKGGERGSLDWILNNFFGEPTTEHGMRYYDVQKDYIVLYDQQYLVKQLEFDRKGYVFVFPYVGEAVEGKSDELYWRLTVLHKNILHSA